MGIKLEVEVEVPTVRVTGLVAKSVDPILRDDVTVRIHITMPARLYRVLKVKAQQERRSLNGHIVYLLEQSSSKEGRQR